MHDPSIRFTRTRTTTIALAVAASVVGLYLGGYVVLRVTGVMTRYYSVLGSSIGPERSLFSTVYRPCIAAELAARDAFKRH